MLHSISLLVLLSFTNTTGSTAASTPSAPRTSGPCALLNLAEIQEALGQPVGIGKEDLTNPGVGCTWSGDFGELSISVQRTAQRLNVAAETQALTAGIPGATLKPLPNLGASAFLLELGDSGAQVHVLPGEHDYLMLSVLGFGNAIRVADPAESLARKALTRL